MRLGFHQRASHLVIDVEACQILLPGLASLLPSLREYAARYGLTRELFALMGADPDRVLPVTSAEFVRPAPRPAYSVLGHERWAEVGLSPMRPWRESLADAWATGEFAPH